MAAARTKLRKLLAAKEATGGGNGARGGSAATGAPAERSPHAKSSYDVSEFETLADKYEGLKWRMISKPGGATVKPDDFYRYGKWMACPAVCLLCCANTGIMLNMCHNGIFHY